MSALKPTDLSRRSFVYRELETLGAHFESVNGHACAMAFGTDRVSEIEAARRLGLADLSGLRRTGYKGFATAEWLRGQGLRFEDAANRAYGQSDGARLARLSKGEFVLLGDLAGRATSPDRLDAAWSMDAANGCFKVPREELSAWFMVSGAEAALMFAKLCGVDLRPHKFPNQTIAQTSLARMNAIVIRGDLADTLAYDLIFDSASAVYLWKALRDAMEEFAGRPVGLDALRALS